MSALAEQAPRDDRQPHHGQRDRQPCRVVPVVQAGIGLARIGSPNCRHGKQGQHTGYRSAQPDRSAPMLPNQSADQQPDQSDERGNQRIVQYRTAD
ncbi:MAG TPA: hypothetical protein VGL06_26330, partial [Pseudonocardiaceae bacterium]